MSGLSRFDCYPSDFLNGIVSLTADEISAYVVILMLQYDRGEPVLCAGRERELAARSGMSKARFDKAASKLAALGKIERTEKHLWNTRATREIARICEKIEKNRENSATGGESTRLKYEKRSSKINGHDRPIGQPCGQPSLGPILLPPTHKEEGKLKLSSPKPTATAGPSPPVRGRNEYSDDFEAFWKLYPTDANMAKATSYDVWKKMNQTDRADAILAVPGFIGYCQSHPDYRAVYADRWLKQRRWEGFIKAAEIGRESQCFVAKDSANWKLWADYLKSSGGKSVPGIQTRDGIGWYFASKTPPFELKRT